MTSITLTGTNHAEDQPVHLRVVKTKSYMDALDGKDNLPVSIGAGASAVTAVDDGLDAQQNMERERQTRQAHVRANVEEYAGLLGRACPAGVYEYVEVRGSHLFYPVMLTRDHQTESSENDGWAGKKLVINSQVCAALLIFSRMANVSIRIVYIASCVM